MKFNRCRGLPSVTALCRGGATEDRFQDASKRRQSDAAPLGRPLPGRACSRAAPLVGLVACLLLAACAVEPQPIDYGSDACAFCRMTIVDKTHAAQLVTRKGKQFKFDAIECLVQNLPEWQPEEVGILLVADYDQPGVMIDASTASYLVSKGIRSPMGANLSAFATEDAARRAREEHTGEIFTWDELADELTSVF